MLRRRFKLIGLLAIPGLLAIAATSSSAQPGPDELPDSPAREVIARSDLPDGISDVVSDEAIALANSPELNAARQAWDEPHPVDLDLNFVDQIDYQLTFRNDFDYLDSSPATIGRVLAEKTDNPGFRSLGLYLTDEEAAERQRRVEVSDPIFAEIQAAFVTEGVEGSEGISPNYAGSWQDQLDGGVVVLAVVDPAEVPDELSELARGQVASLRIITAPRSFTDLNEVRNSIVSAVQDLAVDANVSIDTTPEGRRLRVTVSDEASLSKLQAGVASLAEDLTASELIFEIGPTFSKTGDPLDQHSVANQQPGLAIAVNAVGGTKACTWGVNGNTASEHFMVMAGHCWASQSNTAGFVHRNVFQNRISSTWLSVTPNTSSQGNYLRSIENSTYDMARISSDFSNDNCYHWGHCQKNITDRAKHNSWETGQDVTCASLGTSNVYRCGVITEENYQGSRLFRFNIATLSGDSGSGLVEDRNNADVAIDGIVVQGNHPTASLGQTAWDVKNQLNFDFNCANSPTYRSNPANWANCPILNR